MQTKPRKPNSLFTIVIPSLNEEDSISNLLSDLTNQSFQDFTVIHVDGNSEDKTVEKSKKFINKLELAIKVVKKKNASFQRNAGGNLAKSDWIIFMDADNRLPEYFLQDLKHQIIKSENKNGVDVFTTWVKVEKRTTNIVIEKILNFGLELYKLLGKETAFGAMIGVRKEIFNEINFDETQKILEDALFIKAVIKAGYGYKLYKKPKYTFSLRRLETEGLSKMIVVVIKSQINFLLGKKFKEEDFGYVMKGGEYYKNDKKTPLSDLQISLKTATKEQIIKGKNIWKNLKN